MMKKELLYIFSFFLFIVLQAQAQPLRISGITYIIPKFSVDSTESFNDAFVQSKILPSINSSYYRIEIRAIFPPAIMNLENRGTCIIIKGNSDSLTADCYFLKMRYAIAKEQQITTIKKASNSDYDLMLIKHHVYTSSKLETALRDLLLNRITNLPSNKKIILNLKKRKVKIYDSLTMDCCSDVLYEVKVDTMFRNFTTNAYYYHGNENIKEINCGIHLDNIVYSLLNDNKTNH